MSGTRLGGQRAAATNKERHGDDFYKRIGSRGGRAKTSKPKGFAANPELAAKAGRKGGEISRRTGVTTGQGKVKTYYDGTTKPKPTKELKVLEEERKDESNKKWFRFFRRNDNV